MKNAEQAEQSILRFPRRWFWLLPVLLVIALAIPTVDCYLRGDRLSEVVGEITAYRYFYSLRMIHGEHPWVPNGHTIGLAFKYINHGLTFLGSAETNLFPRIDVALVAFNFGSFLASALLLWRLRERFANDWWLCAMAAAALAILYQEQLISGQFTIMPDYPNLVLPISLATLLLTPEGMPSRPWRLTAALSIFGALLVATKLTFISFYCFPVLWFLIAMPKWSQRVLHGAVLAIAPVALAFAILCFYHGFQWDPTQFNLHFILDFVQNSQVAKPVSYSTWLATTLSSYWQARSYLAMGVVLMPFFALVGLAFPKTRIWAAVTLICSLVPHALIYKRPHVFSFIEPNFLLMLSAVYLLAGLAKSKSFARTRWAAVVPAFCTLLFLSWWLWQLPPGLNRTHNRIVECNETGRHIASFVNSLPGKTIYLIPNNSYNVPTLDNAISKGGTDMHSNTWGDSPFMVALFPDRTYLFGYSPLTSAYDLRPFSKIVTTILHDDAPATYDQLKSRFQIELSDYDRKFSYKINPHVEVVGYVRRQELRVQASPLFRVLPSEFSFPLYISPRELKASCTFVPTPEPHWLTSANEAGPYMGLCYTTDYHLAEGTTFRVRARVGAQAAGTFLIQVTLRPDGEAQAKTVGREFAIRAGQQEESSFSVLLDRNTVVESISIGLANVTLGSKFALHYLEAESLTYTEPTPST